MSYGGLFKTKDTVKAAEGALPQVGPANVSASAIVSTSANANREETERATDPAALRASRVRASVAEQGIFAADMPVLPGHESTILLLNECKTIITTAEKVQEIKPSESNLRAIADVKKVHGQALLIPAQVTAEAAQQESNAARLSL